MSLTKGISVSPAISTLRAIKFPVWHRPCATRRDLVTPSVQVSLSRKAPSMSQSEKVSIGAGRLHQARESVVLRTVELISDMDISSELKSSLLDEYASRCLEPILAESSGPRSVRWLRGAISGYIVAFDPESIFLSHLGEILIREIRRRSDPASLYWNEVHEQFCLFEPRRVVEELIGVLRSRKQTPRSIAERLTLIDGGRFYGTRLAAHILGELLAPCRRAQYDEDLLLAWELSIESAAMHVPMLLVRCVELSATKLEQHHVPRHLEDRVFSMLRAWADTESFNAFAQSLKDKENRRSFLSWYAGRSSTKISLYVIIETSKNVGSEDLEAVKEGVDQLRAAIVGDRQLNSTVRTSLLICSASSLRQLLAPSEGVWLQFESRVETEPGAISLKNTLIRLQKTIESQRNEFKQEPWLIRPLVFIFTSGIFEDSSTAKDTLMQFSEQFFAQVYGVLFGFANESIWLQNIFPETLRLDAMTPGAFRTLIHRRHTLESSFESGWPSEEAATSKGISYDHRTKASIQVKNTRAGSSDAMTEVIGTVASRQQATPPIVQHPPPSAGMSLNWTIAIVVLCIIVGAIFLYSNFPNNSEMAQRGDSKTKVDIGAPGKPVNWMSPPNLSVRGIGPILIGMTLAEARAAAADPLIHNPADSQGCFHVKLTGAPNGLSFMVTDGQISRVDITSSSYSSISGARVGQTQDQVIQLYSGRLEITVHKYDQNGRYLTYIPTEKADQLYRMVFETDGHRITSFRAGKLPEVQYVERCL